MISILSYDTTQPYRSEAWTSANLNEEASHYVAFDFTQVTQLDGIRISAGASGYVSSFSVKLHFLYILYNLYQLPYQFCSAFLYKVCSEQSDAEDRASLARDRAFFVDRERI